MSEAESLGERLDVAIRAAQRIIDIVEEAKRMIEAERKQGETDARQPN